MERISRKKSRIWDEVPEDGEDKNGNSRVGRRKYWRLEIFCVCTFKLMCHIIQQLTDYGYMLIGYIFEKNEILFNFLNN